MSSSSLSASVTRILSLSNFPKELKTRDILSAFSEFETADGGGYKVKWLDDTNLLIVFESPAVAKKAYLSTLLRPHANLGAAVSIKPYDGPDAQAVIAAVNARGGGSVGRAAGLGHGRGASVGGSGSFSFGQGIPPNPYAQQAPPPGLPAQPQQQQPHAHHRSGSSSSSAAFARGGAFGGGGHSRMGSFGTGAVGAGLGAGAGGGGGALGGGVSLGPKTGGGSAASNWGPAVGAKVRVESPPGGRATAEAQRV